MLLRSLRLRSACLWFKIAIFIVILMAWIVLQETLRIAGTQLHADLVAVFVGVIDKENGFERQIIAGRVS